MHYTLEKDLFPIIHGEIPLPNFREEEDLGKAINSLAGTGGVSYPGNAMMPDRHKPWARYFLNTTQSGALDGTGTVMIYDRSGKGRVGTFAICEHTMVSLPGTNPSRGWHARKCSACGLDLSVDSGD